MKLQKQVLKIDILNKEPFYSKIKEHETLKLLQIFEEDKGYLLPLKLNDLAKILGINRTILSAILNVHKGNYLKYMNGLRIQQLISDLTTNNVLRKKSISELSELYGFLNEKLFEIYFKKLTNFTPSYFIKQLELKIIDQS